VGPAELLALARALYGVAPAALVVRVGVAEMEIGEALSPAVSAALPAIVDVVVSLIARHRASTGAGR
jgi:Ni,Fe-hydrogenase maturation factor